MTLPFHLCSSVPADYVYHIFFILLFAPPPFFFGGGGRGRETLFSTVALNILVTNVTNGLPWWLSSKESACNAEAAEDAGSIPAGKEKLSFPRRDLGAGKSCGQREEHGQRPELLLGAVNRSKDWCLLGARKDSGSPRAPGEPRPHARFQESLWDLAPAAR